MSITFSEMSSVIVGAINVDNKNFDCLSIETWGLQIKACTFINNINKQDGIFCCDDDEFIFFMYYKEIFYKVDSFDLALKIIILSKHEIILKRYLINNIQNLTKIDENYLIEVEL